MSECKKCGKSHGMVVHDKITGTNTPMDHCKDCMVYGTFVPITEQIHLTSDQVQDLDQEFIASQMQKMVEYMMRKFIENWVMYGEGEEILNVSEEMEEQYQKAYAAASKQWEEAEIDQRFVPMNYLYEPEPMTEERWKNRLKIMARDLKESQRKYNNGRTD